MQYRTKDGDMLDEICWRVYTTTERKIVETVLELNPGLADNGPILPAGVLIELPDSLPPDTSKSTFRIYA